MAIKNYDEEIYAGFETAWSKVADYLMQPGQGLQARKFWALDQGNPGQLFIGRAGPDGADPTAKNPDGSPHFTVPVQVEPNQNVGHIAWLAYQEDGWSERLTQIHTRFRGPNRGSLHFSTSGAERLILTEDGRLDVSGLTDDNESIKVVCNGRRGKIKIEWEA